MCFTESCGISCLILFSSYLSTVQPEEPVWPQWSMMLKAQMSWAWYPVIASLLWDFWCLVLIGLQGGRRHQENWVWSRQAWWSRPLTLTSKYITNITYLAILTKHTLNYFTIEYLKILCLVLFCHPSSLADIFWDGEEGTFFSPQDDKVIEETTALLKKKSQNDTGHNYKLGETERLQKYSQATLIYTCMFACMTVQQDYFIVYSQATGTVRHSHALS